MRPTAPAGRASGGASGPASVFLLRSAWCRDTKADLDLIGPPTPQQVIGAAASNIEKSLVDVNIDVAKYFAPVASKLLENGVGAARTPVQARPSITPLPPPLPAICHSVFEVLRRARAAARCNAWRRRRRCLQ